MQVLGSIQGAGRVLQLTIDEGAMKTDGGHDGNLMAGLRPNAVPQVGSSHYKFHPVCH